jgi:hypothetical protein
MLLKLGSLGLLAGSGSFKESYHYSNDAQAACAGIVSEVYIPSIYLYYNGSSTASSASFQKIISENQPSFTVQWLMEQELRDLLASIPSWASSDCYWSLQKAFCSSKLLLPELKTFRSVLIDNDYDPDSVSKSLQRSLSVSASEVSQLMSYSFYAPSYPHRSICEDYLATCGAFADRLEQTKGISTFRQDCDARVAQTKSNIGYSTNNGLGAHSYYDSYVYPSFRKQTVETLPFTVVSSNGTVLFNMTSGNNSADPIMLNVTTDANYLANAVQLHQFDTQCPDGFVVPDDKYHPRNHWKGGTGCAEACR